MILPTRLFIGSCLTALRSNQPITAVTLLMSEVRMVRLVREDKKRTMVCRLASLNSLDLKPQNSLHSHHYHRHYPSLRKWVEEMYKKWWGLQNVQFLQMDFMFLSLSFLVQTEECLKKKMRNPSERSELIRAHILEGESCADASVGVGDRFIWFFLSFWSNHADGFCILPPQRRQRSRRRRPGSCSRGELASPTTWMTRSPTGRGPWSWSARTSCPSPAALNRPLKVGQVGPGRAGLDRLKCCMRSKKSKYLYQATNASLARLQLTAGRITLDKQSQLWAHLTCVITVFVSD